jgi:hypothetical protein
MEHLGSRTGAGVVIGLRGDWYDAYGDLFRDGEMVRCAIRLSPTLQAEARILNTVAMLREVDMAGQQFS